MKKRIMCLFLAVVMLLGMIPVAALPQVSAAETISESVMIDFKQSAIDASKQAFWANLKDSTGTVGGKYTTKHISAETKQAAS